MANQQATTIPRVPIQSPMFTGTPDFTQDFPWGMKLSRTWIIFWEKLYQTGEGASGPFVRTLLLKDTAVGNDVGDNVPLHPGGYVQIAAGVLKKAISSDLVVRPNITNSSGTTALPLCTIPAATAVNTAVEFNSFNGFQIHDLDVLTFDVVGSDGSTDAGGVAAFSLYWQ